MEPGEGSEVTPLWFLSVNLCALCGRFFKGMNHGEHRGSHREPACVLVHSRIPQYV